MGELVANFDRDREIINGDLTYSWIAKQIKKHGSCIVAWSDGLGSHFDILFNQSRPAMVKLGNLAGGLKNTYLFVSVMRIGAWGFEQNLMQISGSYIAEKFGMTDGETPKKLAELIGGVRIRL